MRGNVTRRGKLSWRVKFDIATTAGERQTRYVTVKGRRQDAERELARLIGAAHDGTFVEACKITLGEYLRTWLVDGAHGLAGKTHERYRGLAEQQLIPHLGAVAITEPTAGRILRTGIRRCCGKAGGRATAISTYCWPCPPCAASRPCPRGRNRVDTSQCRQHHQTAES